MARDHATFDQRPAGQPAEQDVLLQIEDFTAGTPGAGRLSMTLQQVMLESGKAYALVGASGCGKSVMLSLLYGFPPACWKHDMKWKSWRVFGEPVVHENQGMPRLPGGTMLSFPGRGRIVYLPQSFPADHSQNMRSLEAMTYLYRATVIGRSARQAHEAIRQALHEFEMNDQILTWPLHQLSGGQRRRLELLVRLQAMLDEEEIKKSAGAARVLLLLDEPTSGLDIYSERQFMQFMGDLRCKPLYRNLQISMVISTHAFSLLTPLSHYFDEAILLNRSHNANAIEMAGRGPISGIHQKYERLWREDSPGADDLSRWERIIRHLANK